MPGWGKSWTPQEQVPFCIPRNVSHLNQLVILCVEEIDSSSYASLNEAGNVSVPNYLN